MREIKFRIWDKELKESHIEELQDLCEDDYWYDGETEVWSILYDCNNKQERFVALQYTGLVDKNFYEIYEGDIVKVEKVDLAQIIWDEDRMAWGIKPINDFYFDSPLLADNTDLELEVIGNIYENPDLLKGADNIE